MLDDPVLDTENDKESQKMDQNKWIEKAAEVGIKIIAVNPHENIEQQKLKNSYDTSISSNSEFQTAAKLVFQKKQTHEGMQTKTDISTKFEVSKWAVPQNEKIQNAAKILPVKNPINREQTDNKFTASRNRAGNESSAKIINFEKKNQSYTNTKSEKVTTTMQNPAKIINIKKHKQSQCENLIPETNGLNSCEKVSDSIQNAAVKITPLITLPPNNENTLENMKNSINENNIISDKEDIMKTFDSLLKSDKNDNAIDKVVDFISSVNDDMLIVTKSDLCLDYIDPTLPWLKSSFSDLKNTTKQRNSENPATKSKIRTSKTIIDSIVEEELQICKKRKKVINTETPLQFFMNGVNISQRMQKKML